MITETVIRLKQRAFLLKESFSADSYIDLLEEAAASPELLDFLPLPAEIVPRSVSINEVALDSLCGLIRRCRLASHGNEDKFSTQAADDPLARHSVREGELVSQVVEAVNVQIQTCDLCKRDGRLWPFVDAFALDAPIKSAFEGTNPFEHLAAVLRTYFVPEARQAPLVCAERLLDHLDTLLNAWTPGNSFDVCNRILLFRTTSGLRGGECLDTEAAIGFLGATSVVANTYLAHCPDSDERLATLRLFILLFDIGRKGISLVPKATKGKTESIPQRISRLLGRTGNKSLTMPDQVQSVIKDIGYVPKVIEVEHLERLMPRPLDGDDAGEEFYKAVAEQLSLIVRELSAGWPGSVESLYHLTTCLQGHYDQELYDSNPTVGLEACMMSAGLSIAGLETLLSEDRSEFGLKIATLMIEDGWVTASDDFVGYLLLLYSFFPSEMSAEERRLFGKHFEVRPVAVRSLVVSTALAQLAADERSAVNRLWAGQYIRQPAAGQIRLVRPSEDYASNKDTEHALAADIGGNQLWLRLQPRTRELLVKAEIRWNAECRKLGRDGEWGSLAGDFFLPIEHDLKHWFGFLADEPVRSACIAAEVKIPASHLTAGPIINALKKLPKLPEVVRASVRARGIDANRLSPLMQRMYEVLDIRNQGYHAGEVRGDSLIRIRDAMFSRGLLRMYAECLPETSAP